ESKMMRAIYSNRQLVEVLVDFWFNHFNVFLDKGADRYLVTEYEREAIRPHVLGKFKEMLVATAKSPAMLFYLDNWQSVGPDAPMAGRGQKKGARGLNENYGRELMELHTLRAVMKTMLESKEFFSEGAYRSKMKSPLELVVSAVRAVNGEVNIAFPLANHVAQLGEPLYRKQEPTGYSNSSMEWVNSGGLLG